MVIYIDKSIGKTFGDRELSEKETVFFAQLAYLHRRGFGYLCGEPGSLSCLSKKLPGLEKGIYRALGERHTDSGSVMDAVQRVLVLTFQKDHAALPRVLQKSGKVLFALLPNALDWELGQPCCLLAENLNDCTFFQCVATYYQHKNNLTKLQESFQCHSGGGDATDSGLKERVQGDRRLTLCIVDSDKKYGPTKTHPEPARGGTYKKVKIASDKLKQDSTLPPHEFFYLDVHEVENLIPISLLRKLQDECPTMKAGLDMLDRLKELRGGEPVLYYDFKNGFSHLAPGPKRAYWYGVLQELGGQGSDMPPEKGPEQGQIETPPQPFFPRIRQQFLIYANEKLEKISLASDIHLDTYLIPLWENLGAIVFTWGCASMPYYA